MLCVCVFRLFSHIFKLHFLQKYRAYQTVNNSISQQPNIYRIDLYAS